MSENSKQNFGDGSDNYGAAAKHGKNAAKQFGKKMAKQTAKQSTEAVGRAAVASVKAGAKAGKAVAEIAAGTAAGGPWGAIISAAWAARHTLLKVLVCVCLAVLFIIVTVVALPGILVDNIVDTIIDAIIPGDGEDDEETSESAIYASYFDLKSIVNTAVENGHEASLTYIDELIYDGGYDYELSKANITDNSNLMEESDIYYILASCNVADMGKDFSKDTLFYRLNDVADKMYPVTYEEKEVEKTVTEGEETTTVIVKYIASTIHSFDKDVIYEAFDIDRNAVFDKTGRTYGYMIDYYAIAFKNIFSFGG